MFSAPRASDAPGTTVGIRPPVRPSPIFWLVVAAFVVGGFLAARGGDGPSYSVFLFVVAGWLLSLILHEFAHAYVAFLGGDHTVVAKGYLELDPRKYTDPFFSLLLPTLFVLSGGIALPGGAVWINRGLLRSDNAAAAVSLAGPVVNLVFAVLIVAVSNVFVDPLTNPIFASGIAFLAFLQVMAFVLNMLPIPGLDGFGIIEPYLSGELRVKLAPIRRYGFMILVALLWLPSPVRDGFFDLLEAVVGVVGVDRTLVSFGFDLFRFWERS